MHALPWLLALLLPEVLMPMSVVDVRRPQGWLHATLVVVGGGLGVTELALSERCIARGACLEANPMMPGGPGGGATSGRIAIKVAGTAAVTYVILHNRRGHPWAALAGSIGLVAWNGYLTGRALDHGKRLTGP